MTLPTVDLDKETGHVEEPGTYTQANIFEKIVLIIVIMLIATTLFIALYSGIILVIGVENCGGPLKVLCHHFLTKLV